MAQPHIAIAATYVGGIEKHASANQNAIGFRDQRPDPAHVEVQSPFASCAGQALVDVGPHRATPVAAIGGVDRKLSRIGWNTNAARGQNELTRLEIENEKGEPPGEGKDQQNLRTGEE